MAKSVREAAMDALSRREHSRFELQQKLAAKDYSREEVEAAITRLGEEGLQSDERFIESFISSRYRRGSGPLKILAELQGKGVEESLVSEYLDSREPRWFSMAIEVRARKFGEDVPADFKDKARQARFLQQRGFTSEQVSRALSCSGPGSEWD